MPAKSQQLHLSSCYLQLLCFSSHSCVPCSSDSQHHTQGHIARLRIERGCRPQWPMQPSPTAWTPQNHIRPTWIGVFWAVIKNLEHYFHQVLVWFELEGILISSPSPQWWTGALSSGPGCPKPHCCILAPSCIRYLISIGFRTAQKSLFWLLRFLSRWNTFSHHPLYSSSLFQKKLEVCRPQHFKQKESLKVSCFWQTYR